MKKLIVILFFISLLGCDKRELGNKTEQKVSKAPILKIEEVRTEAPTIAKENPKPEDRTYSQIDKEVGSSEDLKYLRSSNLQVQTPNSEHYAALQFIKYGVPRDDRPFIKFLSLYAVPDEDKEVVEKLLTATVYTLSAGIIERPPQLVPGSNSLYWIDIRDYNWDNKAWEVIALADPYFQEPWINDEDAAEVRKLVNSNFIVRGDWFIAHLTDPTKQVDVGRDALVYILQYSNLGGPPQNMAEFRKAWGVDDKRVAQFNSAIGTIVEKGRSAVSRHERQLGRVGLDTGYYYETNDNKSGVRRYLDNLDPVLSRVDRDASEGISTNFLGWQVYFLDAIINGKAQRVEFGDSTVVVDTSTNTNDVRVRNYRSCIICHNRGLNEADDYFQRTLGHGITLRVANPELQLKLEKFYNSNFNQKIRSDRQVFIDAVNRATGWTTEEFVNHYQEFMAWYDQPLDLAQAAREVGILPDNYTYYLKSTPNASLANLLFNGTVARDVWEEGDNSPFVESMLLIYKTIFVNNFKQEQKQQQKVIFKTSKYSGDNGDYFVNLVVNGKNIKTAPSFTINNAAIIDINSRVFLIEDNNLVYVYNTTDPEWIKVLFKLDGENEWRTGIISRQKLKLAWGNR